jgi:hypothetical protein
MGSTIRHMTAVHPGHELLGALEEKEEEEVIVRQDLDVEEGRDAFIFRVQ